MFEIVLRFHFNKEIYLPITQFYNLDRFDKNKLNVIISSSCDIFFTDKKENIIEQFYTIKEKYNIIDIIADLK